MPIPTAAAANRDPVSLLRKSLRRAKKPAGEMDQQNDHKPHPQQDGCPVPEGRQGWVGAVEGQHPLEGGVQRAGHHPGEQDQDRSRSGGFPEELLPVVHGLFP